MESPPNRGLASTAKIYALFTMHYGNILLTMVQISINQLKKTPNHNMLLKLYNPVM
jgi:hypothetical protein